jgi:hypothetical protein
MTATKVALLYIFSKTLYFETNPTLWSSYCTAVKCGINDMSIYFHQIISSKRILR